MKDRYPNATPIELLLIDDDDKDIFLTKRAFDKGGVSTRIQTARNGEEGLSLLRGEGVFKTARRPDIIFLDLNMPRMSGYEFLEIIKVDDDLKAIPVIVMTHSQSEADTARCYRLHANAFLSKPIELADFMSMIRAVEAFWLGPVRLPQCRRRQSMS